MRYLLFIAVMAISLTACCRASQARDTQAYWGDVVTILVNESDIAHSVGIIFQLNRIGGSDAKPIAERERVNIILCLSVLDALRAHVRLMSPEQRETLTINKSDNPALMKAVATITSPNHSYDNILNVYMQQGSLVGGL